MNAFSYSRFLTEYARRDPDWASSVEQGLIAATPAMETIRLEWESLAEITDTVSFDRVARQLRMRQQAGVYWRILNGTETLTQTMATVTAMAEAALQVSLAHHFQIQVGCGAPPAMAVLQ